MGCSQSRLDDEEAVQLCKDRKRFIKQALEQRARFASGHIAYIHSLKRVSSALRDYIEGDDPREFTLDSSYITTPLKNSTPGFISITPKSFSLPQIQAHNPKSSFKVNYMRSSGNPAFSVEERPPRSPETYRVDAYSPMPNYGFDGFFAMPSSSSSSAPVNSSVYGYSPNNRTTSSIPPPSPQNSQWDFFWNPFSSLDYYGGYHNRSSLDQMAIEEDFNGLKQVREEEGIPDLEEDVTEYEESPKNVNSTIEKPRNLHSHCCREEVTVEDVDDDDDDDDNDDEDDGEETDGGSETETETEFEIETEHRLNVEVSRAQKTVQNETSSKEMDVGRGDRKEETPGFTVYVNRRPTSMAEVIKDLDTQFKIVCNAAGEVSVLLEASSRAHFSSTSTSSSTDLTAMKMLNPVALFRSASSRSSSSRFLGNSSSCKDNNGDESGSELSEDICMFSGSHQSTLDRLYAWEKKLYDQVKSGEKIRIAYEKKCAQLRNQDVKGEDPSSVDKTRVGIRDLHTQIKVSIHSIEAISKRIETLRDEELHPQLLELVQGLARMWKVMAECHQTQKRTLDEAKLLLAGTPSKLDSRRHSSISVSDPQRLARSAANLETELRNWKTCFESWIGSQRSYVHALTGWLLRCVRSDSDTSKLPFSPRRSGGSSLPIFGFCVKWSRLVDDVREIPVLDGLDFFAAGMGSIYAQQQMKDHESHRVTIGSKRFGSGENMELVEVGQVEEVMTVEKMAEVAIRVLCAGMSVAMSSLTEFAIGSADGYEELNQWETNSGSARRAVM